MNKKSLLAVVGLALVALAAVLAISCFKSRQNEAKLQGKLVFARTYDLGDEVDRIVITTADDVIELKQKKSFNNKVILSIFSVILFAFFGVFLVGCGDITIKSMTVRRL